MEKFESLSHVRWEGKSAVRTHRKLLKERRMNQTSPNGAFLTYTPRFAGQAKATAYGRGRLLIP